MTLVMKGSGQLGLRSRGRLPETEVGSRTILFLEDGGLLSPQGQEEACKGPEELKELYPCPQAEDDFLSPHTDR